MTAWDLISIALQRWVVTVLGLLLTITFVLATTTAEPAYLSRVSVVLLPPSGPNVNGLEDASESLISLAGVVAREVEAPGAGQAPVSSGVTLIGEGRREGSTVRQPGTGGQWNFRFEQPVLDVQAIDSTAAEASARMDAALADIDEALASLQDSQGVAANSRVRAVLNPAAPQVSEEVGSGVRAAFGAAVSGVLLTLLALGILGPVRKTPGTELVRRQEEIRGRTSVLATTRL